MKKPLTEKDIGVVHNWEHHKFREVRAKANEEEKERYHSDKRYKERKEPLFTLFEIGKDIVYVLSNNPRSYALIEIVDLNASEWPLKRYTTVTYYGLVKKVSSEEFFDRVGHLRYFHEWPGGNASSNVVDIDPSSIKWLTPNTINE
jgi:hypothetical protein